MTREATSCRLLDTAGDDISDRFIVWTLDAPGGGPMFEVHRKPGQTWSTLAAYDMGAPVPFQIDREVVESLVAEERTLATTSVLGLAATWEDRP